MLVYGPLPESVRRDLVALTGLTTGIEVRRARVANSATPYPSSTDLETALVPILNAHGFEHHTKFQHPDNADGFEYDFWRPSDRVAMEVMGYRADDEIYKDILKFHVHPETHVGVVWLPRWKWISGRKTETNFRAATKALAFAGTYMNVEALVGIVYDWTAQDAECWRLLLA